MERATTVMKTLHGNVTQKSSPTTRDNRSDTSFSSCYNLLTPHDNKPITCQPRCTYVDDYSATTELSIFDAHKYFNGEVVTDNNDNIQKVTAATTSRVSPLATNVMDVTENGSAKGKGAGGGGGGDVIENITAAAAATRYSSASSSVDSGFGGMIRNYRGRSFNGAATPTASSEASWNSQACLLTHSSNAARATPVSTRETKGKNATDLNKKLKLWLLRRKCPCTGRKSVRVKEQAIPTPKPVRDHSSDRDKKPEITPRDITVIAPNTESQRFNPHRIVASSTSSLRIPFTDGFTFPVLNPHAPPPPTANLKLRAQNGVVLREEEDLPPRDSLEVFQPPNHGDAVVEPAPDSPSGGGGDDAASDASSDLFEIESFSTATQSACPAAFRRGAGDSVEGGGGFFYGGGGCRRRSVDEGSTECYEPSEASVVWSVTTAEGCYEESEECGGGGGDAGAEKWRRKGGPTGNGLLVGCRGEKAVSVGPQPVRKNGGGGTGTGEGQRGATCCVSRHVNVKGSRVGGVGVGVGIGMGIGLGSANKPPLPLARPHSNNNNTTPRMSLAFAT